MDDRAAEILQTAMDEYQQWAAYRAYDVSIATFLKEKETQAKAAKYDELMNAETKRNTTTRIELVETTNRAGQTSTDRAE